MFRRNRKPLSKGRQIARICVVATVFALIFCQVIFAAEGETENIFFGTFWSLVPPAVAIILALITKEAYSSLFIGIAVGGFLYSQGNPLGALEHVAGDGIIGSLADSYNAGILVFLVILGIMVVLMNKTGGSAAFGRWAAKNIKSKTAAQIATIVLGILIFIDDYFNCLTVGSVMRPVTDEAKISRAKLAYLIDATAAPICIIAPVSSWAAAVSGYVEEGNGFQVFIQAIPYNFYAILTVVMMFTLIVLKFEYGPMKKYNFSADSGDLFGGMNPYVNEKETDVNSRGRVIDLVFPIIVLIIACVLGLMYSGGALEGAGLIDAFSNADASVGLMYGGIVALLITVIYYLCRRLVSWKECFEAFPEGFKSMVPAILILTFAWTLKSMTSSLGSSEFVESIMANAGALQNFLPAIVFIIACVIAFATGTSWGTFGILIPITLIAVPLSNPLGIICVSSAMAGAVCGDHCSPISDTTIMASAGAQCEHVTHVSTQLPYAITVAAVSFVSYVIAGFVHQAYIVLPIAIVLMVAVLVVIKKITWHPEKNKAE